MRKNYRQQQPEPKDQSMNKHVSRLTIGLLVQLKDQHPLQKENSWDIRYRRTNKSLLINFFWKKQLSKSHLILGKTRRLGKKTRRQGAVVIWRKLQTDQDDHKQKNFVYNYLWRGIVRFNGICHRQRIQVRPTHLSPGAWKLSWVNTLMYIYSPIVSPTIVGYSTVPLLWVVLVDRTPVKASHMFA